MASGRSIQLTRQIGEHLVAAELGRRGYVASPFAGNVPLFDILAANEDGWAIPVQVKAINGGSWQYKADTFLEIEWEGNRQVVRGPRTLSNPNLVCVYIVLKPQESAEKDEFYIFKLQDLQEFTLGRYKSRIRPRNPQSTHCAVYPRELERFRDNWKLIQESIRLEAMNPARERKGGSRSRRHGRGSQ